MQIKNDFLWSKADFTNLLENARQNGLSAEDMHNKVWFSLVDSIHKIATVNRDRYRTTPYYNLLTPGQRALICTAQLQRTIKNQDFVSFLCYFRDIALKTFKAMEILGADEYLKLLQQAQDIFPDKKIPEYAQDLMRAIQILPLSVLSDFDEIGVKFLTARDMKRPLHEYIFAYITDHPEEFCGD